MRLPIDTSVEAEYADGFILSETELDDRSIYIPLEIVDGVPTGPNTLNDILEKRPEAEHGPMIRFSVYFKNLRYDINWTELPDNARPIRFRNFTGDLHPDGSVTNKTINWLRFGYQYTDENGKNVQEVQELS